MTCLSLSKENQIERKLIQRIRVYLSFCNVYVFFRLEFRFFMLMAFLCSLINLTLNTTNLYGHKEILKKNIEKFTKDFVLCIHQLKLSQKLHFDSGTLAEGHRKQHIFILRLLV